MPSLLPELVAPDSIPEISIALLGPALLEGRIDVLVLADTLRGLGRLTTRADYLLNGSRYEHKLELDEGIRRGSVIVPLHFVSHAYQVGRSLLDSKGAQELATLMGILGWGIVPGSISLFRIFKERKGRPVDDPNQIAELLKSLQGIEAALLLKIFNDREVQMLLRAVLRALRKDGIEEFQTRRGSVIVDRVRKANLIAADLAETDAVEEEQEKLLDIEKIALLPHLAWHFSDKGRPFDAQIQDPSLWDRIERGERFGYGDKMRVLLRTTTERDPSGRLTYTRIIPTVYEVEHAHSSQRSLFPELDEKEDRAV